MGSVSHGRVDHRIRCLLRPDRAPTADPVGALHLYFPGHAHLSEQHDLSSALEVYDPAFGHDAFQKCTDLQVLGMICVGRQILKGFEGTV
jgi:hypothetical protein